MIDDVLVRLCAPTLAGIKTGSLFSHRYTDRKTLYDEIDCLNKRLMCKGLQLTILRYKSGSALIYVYRPSRLKQDLKNKMAVILLKKAGYTCFNCEKCVEHLVERLCKTEAFPHEIGLFLGYPPEDVMGFIEKKATGFKCVGLWKVYGDEKAAKKIFKQYKTCTNIYCSKKRQGICLEDLTVAI